MNGQTRADASDLATKIARLIEERGWNQETFARSTGLNRQTIRQILFPDGNRRLRNATVGACAQALGLTVNELRSVPLERLLSRMHTGDVQDENLRRLYEVATQPQLLAWIERNRERAKEFTSAEIDELLSLQGTGGPLSVTGVDHFVELVERKRNLMQKVHAIAGTEYVGFLEQFVELLYAKVQPYGDRA